MNKKAEILGAIIILIIFLAILGLVVWLIASGNVELQGGDKNDTKDDDQPGTILVQTSLSTLYHNQIDPVNPTYLSDHEAMCAAHGGTWYDQRDRIGCYNIPLWDSTLCSDPIVLLLRNTCSSVEGTTWSCDAHNVGCSY